MKKEKAKGKTARKKSAKKTSVKAKPAVDLVEVRKDITNIVGNEAADMAQAVVDEALKGQLAPVKYLFEVAGLYPAAGEAAEAPPEQDVLARTLLRRLGLPEDPVIVPEDDVVVPLATAATSAGSESAEQPGKDESKGEDSQAEAEGKEKNRQPASSGTNPVE